MCGHERVAGSAKHRYTRQAEKITPSTTSHRITGAQTGQEVSRAVDLAASSRGCVQ